MTDRVPYQHFAHPWIATEDDFGMAEPACRCGDRVIPGEATCAEHYIEAVHARWRRFPAFPVTPEESTE